MVVKLVAVRFERHCPCLLRFRDFFLIYAFQRVGIVGLYKYPCGTGFDKVFILLFFPLFGTGQHVEFAVFIGRFRHGIVFPFDGDLARARLITFFHDHSHKVELVGTRSHADVLSFLHVDAFSCDKFRIFLQLTFFINHLSCFFVCNFTKLSSKCKFLFAVCSEFAEKKTIYY